MVNITEVKKYHVSQEELRRFLGIPEDFDIQNMIIGEPKNDQRNSTKYDKPDKQWLIVVAKKGNANDDAFN